MGWAIGGFGRYTYAPWVCTLTMHYDGAAAFSRGRKPVCLCLRGGSAAIPTWVGTMGGRPGKLALPCMYISTFKGAVNSFLGMPVIVGR
jgi:hypothetical protein